MKKVFLSLAVFFMFSLGAQAKVLNIKFNALGLLAGSTSATVHLGLTDKFSIGAGFSTLTSGSTESTGYDAIFQYFFNSFGGDGWYFEGFYSSAEATGTSTTSGKLTVNATAVGGLFGYQWMWSMFNQSVGIGYQQITIDSDDSIFGSISGGLPVLQWKIGLAF